MLQKNLDYWFLVLQKNLIFFDAPKKTLKNVFFKTKNLSFSDFLDTNFEKIRVFWAKNEKIGVLGIFGQKSEFFSEFVRNLEQTPKNRSAWQLW